MMAKQKVGNLGLIAILSIGFVSMIFTSTTPAIAALAAQFPEAGQNISLMSNGHIFTLVPMTLLAGWLTNSGKIKFKVATLVGSALMLIGGCGPALLHASFEIMVVWKLVFGIGLGLMTPLAQALVLNLYEGDKQARYLGWITLLMNFGGIIFQMSGGIIVDMFPTDGWYMHWWVYIFSAVPLLLSFFIPEPERQAPEVLAQDNAGTEAAAKKPSLGVFVWVAGGFLFLVNLFNFPVMMYMVSLFIERGIGGEAAATTAATALSLFTVAGVVAGATYGPLFKLLKRFVLPCGYVLMGIGAFLVFIADNAIVATIGCCCLGFGFSLVMPSFMSLLGMWTDPRRVTVATSITLAVMNLGALAVTPYLQVLEGAVGTGLPLYNTLLIASVIAWCASALVFFVWNPYKKVQAAPPSTDN